MWGVTGQYWPIEIRTVDPVLTRRLSVTALWQPPQQVDHLLSQRPQAH
jgi:hypothetical protein